MIGPPSTERLQPSLLDRLTDDAPGETVESPAGRVIDILRLREIVQRDLSWLLNTQSAEDMFNPARLPMVARSVLNYGVRLRPGEASSSARSERIRRSIVTAIGRFEPRLVPETLVVEPFGETDAGARTLSYEIRADLWAHPVPLELYLRSKVDLTTGEIEMERGY